MATPRSQRVAIWVIAIVLAVGTIGSFFVLIVANNNEKEKDTRIQKELDDFQAKYQADQDKQAAELSKKYFKDFSNYSSLAKPFKAASVTKLEKRDIKKGSGDAIKEGDSYFAYYIGWNPRGVIFDSSLDDKSLKQPLEGSGQLIKGWNEGVIGMKKSGVRELTIPADQAYGSQKQSDDIPANTPLKFVIMIIEDPDPVSMPEMSDELSKYMVQSYQGGMQ